MPSSIEVVWTRSIRPFCDLGDVLQAEDLVGAAVEDLRALWMGEGIGHVGHRLDRLDEALTVGRALVARGLHAGLDDEERLPGAEHVAVGRHVAGVGEGRAIVVDADRCAVGRLEFAGVRLEIARVPLPEMRAVQEFEAWAVDVDALEAVDEAEDLGARAGAVELAELLDEGEDGGADHDVVEHLGLARDAGHVAGERGLGRRNGDLGDHLSALVGHRLREEVAVVVAESVVGEDHRHFLAEIGGDPGRHRLDLAFDVGDAGLERPAVEHSGGDVVALGADEIGHAKLARARGGADDHMAEERAEDRVAVRLRGEFLDDLRAAARVGAVILEQDLDRAAVDAALGVDDPERARGRAFVPAAVGGADAGAVELEAEADRLRTSAPG